jgi:hypothetical protein
MRPFSLLRRAGRRGTRHSLRNGNGGLEPSMQSSIFTSVAAGYSGPLLCSAPPVLRIMLCYKFNVTAMTTKISVQQIKYVFH